MALITVECTNWGSHTSDPKDSSLLACVLCHWVSRSRCFEGLQCLNLLGEAV